MQVFKIEEFVRKRFLPSLPPPPTFIFLALVSLLARPKSRIPFLGLSLLRNQTETLAMQANLTTEHSSFDGATLVVAHSMRSTSIEGKSSCKGVQGL